MRRKDGSLIFANAVRKPPRLERGPEMRKVCKLSRQTSSWFAEGTSHFRSARSKVVESTFADMRL